MNYTAYNKLLIKQVKKKLGEEYLENENFLGFLDTINETYIQYEEDRAMLERTMEISGKEITESYEKLREQQAQLEEAYEELYATKVQLEESEKFAQLSRQLQEVNDKLVSAQEHAKIIQKAILGTETQILNYFEDAFLLYEAKDIVSGDFYWFSEQNSYKIIVAGDCTGHGVPAAFMTIMGYNILNEIVNKDKIFTPDEILYALDKRIINTFHRKGFEYDINDGMDISILVFDEEQKRVSFASAKNSLVLIQKGKIHHIKGSNFPIGDTRYEYKSFEKHTFYYQKNDIFYIYTDGYQDQFGGKFGKKLMSATFRNMLFEIHTKPMKEQSTFLRNFIYDWWGGNKEQQIDDILVIGIKAT